MNKPSQKLKNFIILPRSFRCRKFPCFLIFPTDGLVGWLVLTSCVGIGVIIRNLNITVQKNSILVYQFTGLRVLVYQGFTWFTS
jgi:hypothetical protein